jgi:hypothetical protein
VFYPLCHGTLHLGIGHSTETGEQGTAKSGINFWEGGGKRMKGLRSTLRILQVPSAARCRQGKRSPETTRSTGTGRRNKGCRGCLPLHVSTERREFPNLRGSRKKPMPFRRSTDRRPRLSSSRDCTRPLPKRKRTGRARGARGLFSGDKNAGTFTGFYTAGRRSATIIGSQ